MNVTLRKLLLPLASLRITVVLLLATMLVVYVGTLAQRSKDNFAVQKEFFHSWLAFMPFEDHVPFHDLGVTGFQVHIPDLSSGIALPNGKRLTGYMFPGGYSLIVGILINLIAAHALRFKFHLGDLLLVPLLILGGYLTIGAQNNPVWYLVLPTCAVALTALAVTFAFHGKRTGVIVIHFGIILLLMGELVTSLFQIESQMTLVEGQHQDWAHDVRHTELAIIDTTPSDKDVVTSIPGTRLKNAGDVIADPMIPFDIRIDASYPNADIVDARGAKIPIAATTGSGLVEALQPLRPFTGVGGDASKVNAPGVYITLMKSGAPLHTLMLSAAMREAQPVMVDGKHYSIALRFERYYKPYTIHLLDFKHEKFQGTDKAKSFAAHVQLTDPSQGVDRDVIVQMNHPLRYAGDTIYQSGFDPANDKLTTLQIVRNPGWLMPYLACAIGGLGMLIHFVTKLVGFLARLNKTAVPSVYSGEVVMPLAAPPPPSRKGRQGTSLPPMTAGTRYTLEPKRMGIAGWLAPLVLTALAVIYAAIYAAPRDVGGGAFHLAEWGKIPIKFDGRPMPLDSVARNSLKVISSKETYTTSQKDGVTGKDVETRVQAIKWLADVMAGKAGWRQQKVVRIDEPQVKGLLGLDASEKLFSLEEVAPDAINFKGPDSWREVAPGQFARAAFTVGGDGPGKPAVVSVSDMADQSANIVQNVNRWEQQIGLQPSPPEAAIERFQAANVGGTVGQRVELLGPGTAATGPLRTVAVMVTPLKRTWVFKLTGSPETVQSGLAAFDVFLTSVSFDTKFERLAAEIERANKKQSDGAPPLDLYEQKLVQLGEHLSLFQKLTSKENLLAVPPLRAGEQWRTLGEVSQAYDKTKKAGTTPDEPAFEEFVVALGAWRDNRPADFNQSVARYQTLLKTGVPELARTATFETFYEHFSPVWVSFGLYIFVVVLACLSWMTLGGPLARGAMAVLIFTFLLHSFALISRMYISGRPPVTNLYSSAVFIAWVVVLVCIVLEMIFKNGLPMVAAGTVGFMSLLVADGISFADAVGRGEADTMPQLQAVLDTNFWLATHVTMVTMGYAATFLAGVLAIIYTIGGFINRRVSPDREAPEWIANGALGQIFSGEGRKRYVKMVYGVVCFAMLLSFVGTVLGGIWADQSWGRFWGWDSKENGAVLVVLWNAIVLHARWGGLMKDRGLMAFGIVGNIVTAWSWFGTNQLGIGLHSYGFTEGVVPALMAFWGVNGILAVIGASKLSEWRKAT